MANYAVLNEIARQLKRIADALEARSQPPTVIIDTPYEVKGNTTTSHPDLVNISVTGEEE